MTIPKILKNKKILTLIIIVLIGGGYLIYQQTTKTTEQTRYVLAATTEGTIIQSVSGTGQVSASNQVDLKVKASGNITYLQAAVGQEVKAGTLIAQIDNSDALKSIRDAEISLENAKLSMEKLLAPADASSITQAENSLERAQESRDQAEESLTKAYEDGFNSVTNAFLSLPNLMSGLNDLLFGQASGDLQMNVDWYANQAQYFSDEKLLSQAIKYKDDACDSYDRARQLYDQNFIDYKNANRNSSTSTIETLILESYETTKQIANTVKAANNLIDFINDQMKQHNLTVPNFVATHRTTLNSYTNTTNSQLSSLLSAKTSIANSKSSIIDANRTILEKENSLAELKAGADEYDVRSQKLSLEQRQISLTDAYSQLADYYIKAPFDGVIAAVNFKKGDEVSSASAIATLVTSQKIAEISLNEVDVAKVAVGQKVTLTFDAISDLSISGEVGEVDALGTVSQGVVSYDVKIVFDTQDERIKSGMTVSAAIITDIRQNVLTVPSSAVKSSGDVYYVEIFSNATMTTGNTTITSNTPPEQRQVEVGLSDDSSTEITSGLTAGDLVVSRTISGQSNSTTNTSASSQKSLFQQSGGGPMMR